MMEKTLEDREIAEALTKDYPPVNKNLLNRWSSETKNEDLREAIKQWIEVLENKRPLINLDLYDRLVKMKEVI
jgi:hypothetical protein